jgi:Xaa-Pro aminopeptidase
MTVKDKLSALRQLMEKENIAAVVVPSDDPHKSEYVADHWQARKWLTGFSGSAGTAVVTKHHALLWTDFRYYIQAAEEIKETGFELFKLGAPDVPNLDEWLRDNLDAGQTIALDGKLFSMGQVKKLRSRCSAASLIIRTDLDLIDLLWTDRPPMPCSPAFLFSSTYAGETRAEKIKQICEKIKDQGADFHLMVSLDDIAWTLNLRGQDVHTNPVNISFLLIGPDSISLFIEPEKIDADVQAALTKDRVKIYRYGDIGRHLEKITRSAHVLLDPETVSVSIYQAIPGTCTIIEKPSPVVALKAIKNAIQIEHLRDTSVKDGVAMVNFLHWLAHQPAGKQLSEMSVAGKLFEFRCQQSDFIDNSFDPIMAYGPHSAICHYHATEKTNSLIGDTGIFLTDSGGNYLTGTTDITRTICRGTPSVQQIKDYTWVLKGHMAVADICFPAGTRGVQIDTLARQHLWKQGADFGHGTGHGVGFFLCVHEGPARISTALVDETLKPGMLLTNEPGIYREGQYGMRHENMILVTEAFENEFGSFLKFEQMTFCHFERDLIDPDLLAAQEIKWLNHYHQSVREKISPHLTPSVAQWLSQKTGPI